MTAVDWHGFAGWALENEALRVVVVPELGAKIASLTDKAAGHEWLTPPTHPVRARTVGDSFVEHDLAGWDEMFPTIVACPSPHDPAVMLPDHGEVWALPWQVLDRSGDQIVLKVAGRLLTYTLTRTATLTGATLRLDYQLDNRSAAPLPCLWAAHPLFRANAHTRIALPAQVNRVINVAHHPCWGAPDRPLSYPEGHMLDGAAGRLDRVGDAALHDYRKFYLPPERPVSGAALVQEDIGCSLRLTWDSAVVPYLGVWVDEGVYTRETTVALEPSSGYYDTLSLAMQAGRTAILPPGGSLTWRLDVTCAPA